MKQVVVILLLLIFVKPVVAQNEDLIREVERYILWVDSLIRCCRDSLVVFQGSIIVGGGGGSEVTYWTGDDPFFRIPRIECDIEFEKENEKFDRTRIFHQMVLARGVGRNYQIEEHLNFKRYYKDGELVAIKREWRRGSLRNYTLSRMTIFINNSEIIFFQREGRVRNWRSVKAEIRERYNLR